MARALRSSLCAQVVMGPGSAILPFHGRETAATRRHGLPVPGTSLLRGGFAVLCFLASNFPQRYHGILLNPAFSVQNSLVRASSSLLLYFAQVNPAGTEFTRLSSTVLKRKPLSRNTCLAVHVIRHHCDVIRELARGRHVLRASSHVLRVGGPRITSPTTRITSPCTPMPRITSPNVT